VCEGDDPTRVELGRILHFNSESSDRRLLGKGWSIPEDWGTWSEGDESFLHLSGPADKKLKDVHLTFDVRAYTAGRPPELAVAMAVNGHALAHWRFEAHDWKARKEVKVPASVWAVQEPVEIHFRYTGVRSPAEMTPESTDTRPIALGLVALTVDSKPGPKS
jgi:hypothetical protein